MTPRPPPDRFPDLIQAATRVFLAQGYRRTQMADVAAAMDVAKGTLYLYVESKEALFGAVLRLADAPLPLAPPSPLPLKTPSPGETLREVEKRVSEEASRGCGRSSLRWDPALFSPVRRRARGLNGAGTRRVGPRSGPGAREQGGFRRGCGSARSLVGRGRSRTGRDLSLRPGSLWTGCLAALSL